MPYLIDLVAINIKRALGSLRSLDCHLQSDWHKHLVLSLALVLLLVATTVLVLSSSVTSVSVAAVVVVRRCEEATRIAVSEL